MAAKLLNSIAGQSGQCLPGNSEYIFRNGFPHFAGEK